jgi:hypothetical protein
MKIEEFERGLGRRCGRLECSALRWAIARCSECSG